MPKSKKHRRHHSGRHRRRSEESSDAGRGRRDDVAEVEEEEVPPVPASGGSKKRSLTSPSTQDMSDYSSDEPSEHQAKGRVLAPPPPPPPPPPPVLALSAKAMPAIPAKRAKDEAEAASGASRQPEKKKASGTPSVASRPPSSVPSGASRPEKRASSASLAASGANRPEKRASVASSAASGASRPAKAASVASSAASGASRPAKAASVASSAAASGASRPAKAARVASSAASGASLAAGGASRPENNFQIVEEESFNGRFELRSDALCCFDWDRVGNDHVCSKNGLVLVHHEVGFGFVNLPGLLDHLMSYEISAKKKLKHYWELEMLARERLANADPMDRDPWPPCEIQLFDDVPMKPAPAPPGKGKGKQGKFQLSGNPLDQVYGIVALHTGEFRHWAYNKVWWQEHQGPMPASGDIPPEFKLPYRVDWSDKSVYCNRASLKKKRAQEPEPDYMRMDNSLVVPAASGATHYRAMHLVMGLAELLAHYAVDATAKEIYQAWLKCDAVIQKRSRDPQWKKH